MVEDGIGLLLRLRNTHGERHLKNQKFRLNEAPRRMGVDKLEISSSRVSNQRYLFLDAISPRATMPR